MSALRVWVAIASVLFGLRPLMADVEYSVWGLGSLGGESFGYALNHSGQTTGKSKTPDNQFHAFFRDEHSTPILNDLGTLGGTESFGTGINNTGQVAGWSRNAAQNFHAFRWTDSNGNDSADPGETIDLGTLDGDNSGAYAINASGQVAGQSDKLVSIGPLSIPFQRAFLWTDLNNNSASDSGEMINLGTLTGNSQHRSLAYGLNDHGAVVGESHSTASGNPRHAFYWQDANGNNASDTGEMIDLGTLGGSTSQAQDVNNFGQVVGSSSNGAITTAALWIDTNSNGLDQSDIVGLGTLGGDFSEAKSISNAGLVVGYSDTGLPDHDSQHAFVYRDQATGIEDLNNLIDPSSGWTLQQAWGINDHGVIVGYGINSSMAGTEQAFLLVPANATPLPGDYNNDGVVNAGDYSVWRDNLGANVQLSNEAHGVTPGRVTVEDYNVWRAFYGQTRPNGGGSTGGGFVLAPEPCSLPLLAASLALFAARSRRCPA